jgi:hypothetical protein
VQLRELDITFLSISSIIVTTARFCHSGSPKMRHEQAALNFIEAF